MDGYRELIKIYILDYLYAASEGVPSGIRVRINNLPKKKNIYRDLKSAFKGVPGTINISPVNSGNKKTRDPVCKGLAFVDFKSVKDANRYRIFLLTARKQLIFRSAYNVLRINVLTTSL